MRPSAELARSWPRWIGNTAALFGRSYGGMVETYQCEDAEAILVTLGSVAGTARCVVDAYRQSGKKVGLVKIRCMCPFPAREIADAVRGAKAIGVLEKNINFGYEGTVFSEVNSALKQNGTTGTRLQLCGRSGRQKYFQG